MIAETQTQALIHGVEFQMSLVLFMALGGYLLSHRISQPAVVGVILCGIIIGPSGFDIIRFTDFIASVGHIGAIILLFAIGLESHIRATTKPSCFFIALGGVIIPWAAGYYTAELFGYDHIRAIIVGVALTATSIAITADTLRELGKLQTSAAQAIIGAAIIDDILALLALTVGRQMSTGDVELLSVLFFATKALIFIIGGTWGGRRLLAPLIDRIDKTNIAKKYPDFVFILAMQISFLYAMVAELMGLSAIVGAFLAGTSLARVKARNSLDFREGTEFLRIVFGAVFFISLGILADIRDFTWSMAWFTLFLSITATLSKVIGCGTMARLCGLNMRDSLIVGVGMSPRGEMTMAIALIAFIDETIQQPVFVALVVTSLFTTIAAPLILRNFFYKKEDISGNNAQN